MSYYAIKCNECKNWSVCELSGYFSNYTFKCRRCHISSKLKKKGVWGLSNDVSPKFSRVREASDWIKKKTNELNTDFVTYRKI